MKKATSPSLNHSLQEAIRLAEDISNHQQAQRAFEALHSELKYNNPEAAELVQMLWQSLMSAQRSAAFWQELCQVEKHLSERITENHLQLKQNYLRLMQEQ